MAQESLKSKQIRMTEILKLLKREYPEAECSLIFSSPFQLFVATVLSAQCTDARVNLVTPELFKKFPTAQAMSQASLPELEKLIQSTGFFRSKALSLLEASKALVEHHQGQVPRVLDDLIQLRGVGRKTANVVLGVAYGIPGLVVDTHIRRLSQRMGFTLSTDPEHIEKEMEKIVIREDWTHQGHLFISHGRAICTARRARCEDCSVARLCPKRLN